MENLSDGAPKKEDPPPEDETNEKDENLLGFAEETVECIPERRELIVEEPMALDCIQEEIMMCYDMPRAFHIQDEHGFAYQSDLETDEIVERPLVKQELLKMPETVEYIPERRVERRPTVESTMHDAVCIQQQMIFYDEPTALPLQEDLAYQSETACVQLVSLEKFTPLFAKERVTEQEVYIMGQIQGPFLKSNASLPKKRIPNADERYKYTYQMQV
ncbi:uncharacterized protein LOC114516582 [Dendronephthya gigantea]|uniref:uncharacterized protein LOC114516582 n=1 Tax=Dendronephthya gigantea TaxID=151771 RepID=UPI00106C23B6|nr:uncharacterized protein LOC114516582 [Dendronephthya gigantea]